MNPVHENIRQTIDGRLICEICDNSFLNLGTHLWGKHAVLARDYRDQQHLPHRAGLVAMSVKRKLAASATERMVSDPDGFTKWMEKGREDSTETKRKATYRRRVGGGIVDMSRDGRDTFTCVVCGVGFEGYKSAAPKYCPEHVAEYRLRAGFRLHNRYMEKMRDPVYHDQAVRRFQENIKPKQTERKLIHRARVLAAADLYSVGYLVIEIADILGIHKANVGEMLTEAGLGDLRTKASNRYRRERGDAKPPPGIVE